MTALVFAVGLLAVLAYADAAPKTCSIDRYGKVTTFSGEALDVEAPCKYKLAQFTCGAFKVFVTAGSALDGDSNNRFSPDTAWIKVQRELGGQTVEWIGRTSAGLIKKKAADPTGSLEVWTVKEDSLTVNNGFVGGSTPAAKLAKTVDGTTFFEIFIREPDTSGDDAGITVSCLNEDDFSDSKAYPKSICGDGAATNTVNQRKLVLFPGGGGDRSKTVLFDILNDVTITQSKTCSLIAFLFQNDCGGDAEKAAAIDTCGNIFGKRPLAKCLVNDGAIDDDFRKCLINKCYDAACNQLKTTVNDAANACPGDALTSDGYLRQLTCAQ